MGKIDSPNAGNANLPIGGILKKTNPEIGGPGGPGHRGWHSRGYLPHYDGDVETQHVTFHLTDSLRKRFWIGLKQG